MPNSALYNSAKQERLIKDLQNGGPNASLAMKELYENYQYKNYIAKYSSEFNIPSTLVKDFLQDAFVTFIQKAKNKNFPLPKDVNVYITSIAKNLIQNHSRRLKTEEIAMEDSNKYGYSDSLSKTIIDNETKKALKDILSQLDPICKRVLRLWANDFSFQEIASKLDLSSDSRARQKKHRCLKKLIELIPVFPHLKDFSYE